MLNCLTRWIQTIWKWATIQLLRSQTPLVVQCLEVFHPITSNLKVLQDYLKILKSQLTPRSKPTMPIPKYKAPIVSLVPCWIIFLSQTVSALDSQIQALMLTKNIVPRKKGKRDKWDKLLLIKYILFRTKRRLSRYSQINRRKVRKRSTCQSQVIMTGLHLTKSPKLNSKINRILWMQKLKRHLEMHTVWIIQHKRFAKMLIWKTCQILMKKYRWWKHPKIMKMCMIKKKTAQI